MGVDISVHGKHSELLVNKERYGANRLYGYNASYENIKEDNEKFGERVVRKLKAPSQGSKTIQLGSATTKNKLRTSDVLGVKKLWTKFANHPEGKWTVGQGDAYNLARFIVENKPQNILDLGTGIGTSAAVMKFMSHESNVVSVEQSKKCVDLAESLVPAYSGHGVNIVHCEPEYFTLDEIPEVSLAGYKDLPAGKWDFVVIDGPGDFLHNGNLVKPVSGDIFRILDQINPEALVYIDGRNETAKTITRFLRPFLELVVDGNGFTVFKRTKQTYKKELVVDTLKEKLIKERYFK